MDYKNSTQGAENTTVTRNVPELYEDTNNVYESIVILAKRANQLSTKLKEELNSKLAEFASTSDNLEEVFENREQIEISRFYERLPKPVAVSISEFQSDSIYYRRPEDKN
jgi:DNA-directed RNA polymerase subunit K/omega